MASQALERKLRLITIITFIPAFAMLLGGAIASSGVLIGMGILPMVWSSLSGLVRLSRSGADFSTHRPILSGFIDLSIACVFLGILLPFWIIETDRLNYHPNFVMVETYASTFLMLNAGIHFFLGFSRLCTAILSLDLFKCRECAECSRNAGQNTVERTRDGVRYSLLDPIEEEYRDSIDGRTTEVHKEPKDSSASAGAEDAMLAHA